MLHRVLAWLAANQERETETKMPLPYRTALIVGAGPGISASLARALAGAGVKVGLAARDIDKLARSPPRPAPQPSPSMPPIRGRSPRCSTRRTQRSASRTSCCLQRQRPGARPDRRDRSGGGAHVRSRSRPSAASWSPSRRRGAWCRTGAARSCSPAPPPASRASAVVGLRHGQVRPARPGAERRARTGAARASMSPISSSTAACAAPRGPTRPTGPTARSTPTASPRPISTCCASRAAPGRWEVELRPWVETF